MPQKKTIDLEELLRLHKTGLSDSALARSFGVARKVIARRREELNIQSNKSQHTRSGTTDKIMAYLISCGGAARWSELNAVFGKRTLIYYGDKFKRILFRRQEVAIVHLPNYEERAREMFAEYVKEREAMGEQQNRAAAIIRKHTELKYDFVTSKELMNAIALASNGRVELKHAEQIADYVIQFFGCTERIIDNILTNEDRDVFYILEDIGVLKTNKDEEKLYDGRTWRIAYWCLEKDRVLKILSRTDVKLRKNAIDNIYEQAFAQINQSGDSLETTVQNASLAAASLTANSQPQPPN